MTNALLISSYLIADPFNLGGGITPFTTGLYQVTYRNSPGDDFCQNDMNSTVNVTSNTLQIKTCFNGTMAYGETYLNSNTFLFPLNYF